MNSNWRGWLFPVRLPELASHIGSDANFNCSRFCTSQVIRFVLRADGLFSLRVEKASIYAFPGWLP